MPFSQLVKLFRGVSQIFINLVGGGGKERKCLDRQRPCQYCMQIIKETIMTITLRSYQWYKLPSVEQAFFQPYRIIQVLIKFINRANLNNNSRETY